MVRKQTWILLAVFVVLLGAAYYLTKNPLPEASANTTPSPTEPAQALEGWKPGDITAIEVKDSQGSMTTIAQDSSGNWLLDGEDAVDAGKVEEVSASLLGMRAQTVLDPGYAQDVLGLDTPAYVLTLQRSGSQPAEVRIGKLTPTESGYYVQIDQRAPIVVSKGAIDDLLRLVSKASLLNWTPTPEPTMTPEGTITPGAADAFLTPEATRTP